MKQSRVILRFLFPPRQDAAKPVHPAMCSLYNPATSLESSLMLNRLCLFTTRTNMSSVTKFFHQAGPLSWHHPSTAMTSQYLLTHHNLLMPLPKVSEKFQLAATAEIVSAPYCWNKYLFHSMRSTGSRFAIRKISQPSLCDPALLVCRLQRDECLCALAVKARFFPITRLKSCIVFLFFVFHP